MSEENTSAAGIDGAAEKVKSLFTSQVFIVFIIGLVVLAIVWAYFRHLNQPGPAPVNVTVKATAAKETEATPQHTAPVKNGSVRVYGAAVKNKLVLPREVIENQQEQVVASTQVRGDDHPQTTTTTLNLDTGEFQTFTRRDPLPWIAWDDHGKLGMYAGYKNGRPAVRVEAEQGIFQVKAIHFGVTASVDQQINPPAGETGTDYFVGAGAWYRW